MNAVIKYGLISPGQHLELKNLYRNGEAIQLFDTEVAAREWLGMQLADNKQYFKVIQVALTAEEKQAELKEV